MRNGAEAIRRSGLSAEAFYDALELARVMECIEQNSINKAGLNLLEASEAMNAPLSAVCGVAVLTGTTSDCDLDLAQARPLLQKSRLNRQTVRVLDLSKFRRKPLQLS